MIRNIKINPQEGGKYPGDDIPSKVLTWLENNKRHVDAQREDIVEGQVVVILEGSHTSMRGVFIKKLPKNLVLVAGPESLNGVSLVVLNQRYVHSVSVFVPLPKELIDSIEVNTEEIEKIRDWTTENAKDLEILEHIQCNGLQEKINSIVEEECSKTKGLKTYFKTPFALPKSMDPFSVFY
ncbi:large subunit ribosomal protein L6e [Nematocida sp. LUAm3]|nr:large subunit ribosomal protein L6e [Nematocida sp. LUAm3]KAI5173927.1 large subunit ribosomal protein L6e [Nematocida sp. LUAm2]KAI5177328.1 large subunit ribosomal protein L6e [Nematocida sp. LUAm1]